MKTFTCNKCNINSGESDRLIDAPLCGKCGERMEPLISDSDPVAEVPCNVGLEAIAFLLTLVPEWVTRMEKGLPETFHGKESLAEGKRIVDKVKEIRRTVEKESH